MSQEYKTGDKRQSQSRAPARMQASDVVNVATKGSLGAEFWPIHKSFEQETGYNTLSGSSAQTDLRALTPKSASTSLLCPHINSPPGHILVAAGLKDGDASPS